MPIKLTERQRVVLAEAIAEIDTPYPGKHESGPRYDQLVLTIRNRVASRHRAAHATGMEKPGIMLSEDQVRQLVEQLVEKGLLVVARAADYSKRVSVTDAGRDAVPRDEHLE